MNKETTVEEAVFVLVDRIDRGEIRNGRDANDQIEEIIDQISDENASAIKPIRDALTLKVIELFPTIDISVQNPEYIHPENTDQAQRQITRTSALALLINIHGQHIGGYYGDIAHAACRLAIYEQDCVVRLGQRGVDLAVQLDQVCDSFKAYGDEPGVSEWYIGRSADVPREPWDNRVGLKYTYNFTRSTANDCLKFMAENERNRVSTS